MPQRGVLNKDFIGRGFTFKRRQIILEKKRERAKLFCGRKKARVQRSLQALGGGQRPGRHGEKIPDLGVDPRLNGCKDGSPFVRSVNGKESIPVPPATPE